MKKLLAILTSYVNEIGFLLTRLCTKNENIKELSKIEADTVKIFRQVSSDNIHKTTTTSSSSA